MSNWLQKLIALPAKTVPKSGASLPVAQRGPALPTRKTNVSRQPEAYLPNATVIYGIGASLLFVASVSLLLAGRWFMGLGVFALGCCLVGYALHFLKHRD